MNIKSVAVIPIILVGIVVFTALFIGLLFTSTSSLTPSSTSTPYPFSSYKPSGIIPTGNTPQLSYPQQNLYIIEKQPADGEQNVSLNQQIIITFNRSLRRNEFQFAISPNIAHLESIQGPRLIITHTQPFLPNTIYAYTFDYSQQGPDNTYTFATKGTGPLLLNTYSNPHGQSDEWNRQNHPDAFLATKTPYSNSVFSLFSTISTTEPAHFYFTVTLFSQDSGNAKQQVIDWIKSEGLNDAQIQTLDIRYQ